MSGRTDSGSASLYFVVLLPALLAIISLVVDGGVLLNEWRRASDLADSAARVGAQKLDMDTYYRSDRIAIDQDAAQAAVYDYLARAGATGETTFGTGDGDGSAQNYIEVTVTIETSLVVPALAGFSGPTVTGRGDAIASPSNLGGG